MKGQSHIPTQQEEKVLAVSAEIFEPTTSDSFGETIGIRDYNSREMTANIFDCQPQNLSSQSLGQIFHLRQLRHRVNPLKRST